MEVGYSTPKMLKSEGLFPGEVGYIIAGIKKVSDSEIAQLTHVGLREKFSAR